MRLQSPIRSLTLLLSLFLLALPVPAWSAGPADGSWAELIVGARTRHTAIYDPVRDRMIVYGGTDNSVGNPNDVWALSLADPPAWTKLTPAGTSPGARSGHSAIYDPVRDRMIVFGGCSSGSFPYLNDVWALSLAGASAWTALTPNDGPVLCGHSAIYDPVRDRMVVFGGTYVESSNNAWSLSLARPPVWAVVTPVGTPP